MSRLDYCMDPFRLDGNARFSWWQNGVARGRLDEFERTASKWRVMQSAYPGANLAAVSD